MKQRFAGLGYTLGALLVVTLLTAGSCPPDNGGDPPSRQTVQLTTIDYSAQDGDYDLNWPGPPRRKARWSDVEFYTPEITLSTGPATAGMMWCFYIKEDRSFWPDPELGFFCATWTPNNPTANIFAYVSQGPDASAAPSGAPASTDQGFWLTCTKKGKVKGNNGKGDDQHARVYLEAFDIVSPAPGVGVSPAGPRQSPRHTVRCQ